MSSLKRTQDEEPFDTVSNSLPKRIKLGSKPFLHVAEGNGGNYCFYPQDANYPQYIGTTECNTCVGVYWTISDSMCFFAHFNYDIRPTTGQHAEQMDRLVADYEISKAAARLVFKSTKDILNDFQWQGNWGPITRSMKSSVKMICPHSGVKGKMYVGDAIALAIRDFLGILDTDYDCKPDNRYSGMIVRHTAQGDGEVEYVTDGDQLPVMWTKIEADGDVPVDKQGDVASAGIRVDGAVEAEGGKMVHPPAEKRFKYRWY